MLLTVRPNVFHRIQFRCVGRQVLHFQTAVLVTNELRGDCAFVSRKPIPNQQNVSFDVAEQVFEKLDDLLGPNGLLEDLEVEVPDGEAGDN